MRAHETSFPIALMIGVLFAFLISLAGAFVIHAAKHSLIENQVYGKVPEFTLEEMGGAPFTSDSMSGRVWIVDFIFTNCQSACPIMSGQMSNLYKLYVHSDKVHFLSISVDPERDTVETLAQYAKLQGVNDDRWKFGRGPIDEIINISEKGFLLAAENLPMGHSTNFILVDENMNIRGYYDALLDSEIDLLKTHVRELVRKM